MAATLASRSHGFASSWANAASFLPFDRCGAHQLPRRLPNPWLPLTCPTLCRPASLLQLRCSPLLRRRCGAAASPPPEPPSGEDRDRAAGLQEMFYRTHDAIRIFFAVFFWMSLFWASAWDGGDDIRPNKRPPFRR